MELEGAVRLCGQKRQDERTNQPTTCSHFRSLLAASSFRRFLLLLWNEQHLVDRTELLLFGLKKPVRFNVLC